MLPPHASLIHLPGLIYLVLCTTVDDFSRALRECLGGANCPGLQVLSGSDEWLDMPILPGAVCVNVGSTLQHLSGGKMVATIHRVNTSLIPDGETRISLPFFLLPKFEGALIPFSADDSGIQATGGGTDYGSEDRGMMAAYNRMSLFPYCTKRWWTAEYQRIMNRVRRAEAVENSVARAKVLNRRQTKTAAL